MVLTTSAALAAIGIAGLITAIATADADTTSTVATTVTEVTVASTTPAPPSTALDTVPPVITVAVTAAPPPTTALPPTTSPPTTRPGPSTQTPPPAAPPCDAVFLIATAHLEDGWPESSACGSGFDLLDASGRDLYLVITLNRGDRTSACVVAAAMASEYDTNEFDVFEVDAKDPTKTERVACD